MKGRFKCQSDDEIKYITKFKDADKWSRTWGGTLHERRKGQWCIILETVLHPDAIGTENFLLPIKED